MKYSILIFVIVFLCLVLSTMCCALSGDFVSLYNPSFEIAEPYDGNENRAHGWDMTWTGFEWMRVSSDYALEYTTDSYKYIDGNFVVVCDTDDRKIPSGFDWIHGEQIQPGDYTFSIAMAAIGNYRSMVYFIVDGQKSEFIVPSDSIWRTYSGVVNNVKIPYGIWIGCYNTGDDLLFLDNICVCNNTSNIPEPSSFLSLVVIMIGKILSRRTKK